MRAINWEIGMRMIRQRGNRNENDHWEIGTRMLSMKYG
jgi:hypothetical protein